MAIIRWFWLSSSTAAAAGPLLLEQRGLQTAPLTAMADCPNGLRSEWKDLGVGEQWNGKPG